MDILNYILMASGGLFVIAMLFICLGLFLNPRKNKVEELAFDNYYQRSDPNSNRTLNVDSSQEANDIESDDELDVSNIAEESEDTEENEDNKESNDEENEVEPDQEKDKEKDAHKNTAKVGGIKIRLNIIDAGEIKDIIVYDDIIIGRNPRCDVVINEPMVSSSHCIISREKDKLMIEDDNSTNGTRLNGKSIKHIIEIKNNDVLTLGDRSIRINLVK